MYEDLKHDLRRLTNQLRAQLHRYYPQILRLCSAADEPWIWDILERAPLPERGARMREASVERLLRDHRVRRIPAADVVDALKSPPLPVAPGAAEAARDHVLMLLPRIRVTRQQMDAVEAQLGRLLDEMESTESEISGHHDVAIIRSWPGQGMIVAAMMLAEAWRPLGCRDYHWLRAVCGVAPVTRQSGRSRQVVRPAISVCALPFTGGPAVPPSTIPRQRPSTKRTRLEGTRTGEPSGPSPIAFCAISWSAW
jgi:hypothetical protein